MSILGDAVVIGSGGETASIVLTVPHGATAVSCTTPAGVVLTGVCVVGTDTDVYTFARLKVYGSYVCSATQSGTTKTQTVVVDAAETIAASISPVLLLFDNGNQCISVTGGYTQVKPTNNSSYPLKTGWMSIDSTHIITNSIKEYGQCGLVTALDFDITEYSKIKFDITANPSVENIQCRVKLVKSAGTYCADVTGGIKDTAFMSTGIQEIDLIGESGMFHLLVWLIRAPDWGSTFGSYIDKIWLE